MIRTGIALAALAALATASAASGQDEAIRLTIQAPSVVARGAPIPLRVAVAADPGAMNGATGPLRLRVRLAPECASTFAATSGPVAIDRRLPAPGAASAPYTANVRGSSRVAALGAYSVCAFVEEEGDDRLFAADSGTQLQATQACTTATRKVTRATAALRRARRAHLTGRVRTLRRRLGTAAAARRRACGA